MNEKNNDRVSNEEHLTVIAVILAVIIACLIFDNGGSKAREEQKAANDKYLAAIGELNDMLTDVSVELYNYYYSDASLTD